MSVASRTALRNDNGVSSKLLHHEALRAVDCVTRSGRNQQLTTDSSLPAAVFNRRGRKLKFLILPLGTASSGHILASGPRVSLLKALTMAEIKPDSEPTVELLTRVRTGEQAAFEGLFARHRPWLRQLVEWRLDDRLNARLDPSDVVQETQLEAYRRLDDFLARDPMPFRLWLRKTLDERLAMLERRHLGASRRAVDRERQASDGKSAWLVERLTGGGPTASQVFVQDEMAQRACVEAIAALADLDREILLMRKFEALSYNEVAYLLGVDAATARKRHGRALLRLHESLAKQGLTEWQG